MLVVDSVMIVRRGVMLPADILADGRIVIDLPDGSIAIWK